MDKDIQECVLRELTGISETTKIWIHRIQTHKKQFNKLLQMYPMLEIIHYLELRSSRGRYRIDNFDPELLFFEDIFTECLYNGGSR